jgi:hypothetical protein
MTEESETHAPTEFLIKCLDGREPEKVMCNRPQYRTEEHWVFPLTSPGGRDETRKIRISEIDGEPELYPSPPTNPGNWPRPLGNI